MSETNTEKQKNTVTGATEALQKLRVSAGEVGKMGKEQIDKAVQYLEEGRKGIASTTKEALDQFNDEITFWRNVSSNPELRGELQAELGKQINMTIDSIGEKWKSMTVKFDQTAEGAKSGVTKTMEATGLNKVLDGFIKVGGKIGDFMHSMMEYLKPKLGKLASLPGISYLIGEENLKRLHAFLGYDENMQKLQDEIRDRLPNDVAFNITDKKEMTQFNDLYDQMLRKKNETPTKYSKGAFFNEILGDYLKIDQLKPENGKKTLVMTQILTAGKELLKNTKEVTPPATTTPPATSTPKA